MYKGSLMMTIHQKIDNLDLLIKVTNQMNKNLVDLKLALMNHDVMEMKKLIHDFNVDKAKFFLFSPFLKEEEE